MSDGPPNPEANEKIAIKCYVFSSQSSCVGVFAPCFTSARAQQNRSDLDHERSSPLLFMLSLLLLSSLLLLLLLLSILLLSLHNLKYIELTN